MSFDFWPYPSHLYVPYMFCMDKTMVTIIQDMRIGIEAYNVKIPCAIVLRKNPEIRQKAL